VSIESITKRLLAATQGPFWDTAQQKVRGPYPKPLQLHAPEDIRLLLDVVTAVSREKSPGPNCRCADGFACEWCQGLAEATGKALAALEQAP
jgi:hypothetical protein